MTRKDNSVKPLPVVRNGPREKLRAAISDAVSVFQRVVIGPWSGGTWGDMRLFVYNGSAKIENIDATLGGHLQLHGKRTTPANNDVAGNIRVFGEDDDSDDIIVGEIYFQYNDVTGNPGSPKPADPGAKLTSIILAVDEEYVTVFPLKVIGNNAMLAAPDGAIGDSSLDNAQLHFYLDESANQLKVKVKYAGGTVKTGTVASLA